MIHSDGGVQKARSETEVASDLSEKQFHLIADATFDQLLEYMTEVEECDDLDDPDINYSQGVMSIKLGAPHGTWVINKQTPNRQIWWSSPISGPLRYELSSDTDFEAAVNEQDRETLVVRWKSTKDGTDLLRRLRDELQSAIAVDIISKD
jgi:frataxin